MIEATRGPLLTVPEVAELLDVPPCEIRRAALRGHLAHQEIVVGKKTIRLFLYADVTTYIIPTTWKTRL